MPLIAVVACIATPYVVGAVIEGGDVGDAGVWHGASIRGDGGQRTADCSRGARFAPAAFTLRRMRRCGVNLYFGLKPRIGSRPYAATDGGVVQG